jgi:beta-mannosidase
VNRGYALRRSALLGVASIVACAPAAPSAVATRLTAAAVVAVPPRPLERLELAGSWKYLPYDGAGDMASADIDDAAWPAMNLPSSWFLLGHKEYPPGATAIPPAFGNNAPGELWPVKTDAGLDYNGTIWFRRTFDWHGDGRRPAIVDLDMVDYYAEVFVNGMPLGRHEGYFQHWSVDATRAVHAGKNEIAVKVSAPSLAFDMSQQYAISWPKMQNQIKGIFAYHDTRPGATSPHGQERSTGGILRGVALRESSGIDLSEVSVTPLDVSETSARLEIEATVHNWGDSRRDVSIDGLVRADNFDDARTFPVHVTTVAPPGISRAHVSLVVDHPSLWWSWDQGKPNLYDVAVHATHDGVVDGERVTRFGIRSITRDADWVVKLNGRRMYLRGTNYIATQWLSQADREFYARDLDLVVGAHLNSVRVHAHLERPEFYDLADERGILIWQDFPLQWGYTTLPEFRAEALHQAEDMVRQYGDHPSIGLWCMHNEAPYAMTWMKRRDPNQNLDLDEALADLARRLDPSRIVQRDSGTGDGHYYYGWYDGKLDDVATAHEVPMVTEYGAAALPAVETLRTMFDEKTLWPRTAAEWEPWKFADFQPHNTFDVAKVKAGRDLAELVRNTQKYQAIVVRYTTELFRRRKWAGSTGIYQFMFVDDWPSITWSVLDYYRRPKLGYAALEASMQPLLPSVEYDPQDPKHPVAIYVVNDRAAALPGARVVWRVAEGETIGLEGEKTLDIPADGVVKVVELGALPTLATRQRLEVRIVDAAGHEQAHSTLAPDDFVDR